MTSNEYNMIAGYASNFYVVKKGCRATTWTSEEKWKDCKCYCQF